MFQIKYGSVANDSLTCLDFFRLVDGRGILAEVLSVKAV